MAFALWRARALDVVPVLGVLGGGAAHAKGPTAQLDDARAQAAQAAQARAAQAASFLARMARPAHAGSRRRPSRARGGALPRGVALRRGEPWEGIAGLDAAVYAGFATTQAAVAEGSGTQTARGRPCGRRCCRRGGALPAAAALAAASRPARRLHSLRRRPGLPRAVGARAGAGHGAPARERGGERAPRALHSQQLAAAAAADVQRESSAALSEVAQ